MGTIWKVSIHKKRVKYAGKVYGRNFRNTAEVHCGYRDGHTAPDYLMLVDLETSTRNVYESLEQAGDLILVHVKEKYKEKEGKEGK